jgi:hypothetical protein
MNRLMADNDRHGSGRNAFWHPDGAGIGRAGWMFSDGFQPRAPFYRPASLPKHGS